MHYLLTLLPEKDDCAAGKPIVGAISASNLFPVEHHERLGAIVASMAVMSMLDDAEDISHRGQGCGSV